jgi:hypothetical protein
VWTYYHQRSSQFFNCTVAPFSWTVISHWEFSSYISPHPQHKDNDKQIGQYPKLSSLMLDYGLNYSKVDWKKIYEIFFKLTLKQEIILRWTEIVEKDRKWRPKFTPKLLQSLTSPHNVKTQRNKIQWMVQTWFRPHKFFLHAQWIRRKITTRVETNGSAVSNTSPFSCSPSWRQEQRSPPTILNIRHFTRSSVATINIRQQCSADPTCDIHLGEHLEMANCIRRTWGQCPVRSNGIPPWDLPTSVFCVGLCYRSVICDAQGWDSKDFVWKLQAPQSVLHNSIVIRGNLFNNDPGLFSSVLKENTSVPFSHGLWIIIIY